ncbi:MAG: MGMT family protein [Candidatus Dojkabacteria bacterium]
MSSLVEKYKIVFEKLLEVPKGRVTTYKELAKACDLNSSRLVGKVLHRNPDNKKYPCHRVLRSDRTLADGYAFGGEGIQKQLLENEGVAFEGDKVRKEFLYYFI